MQKGNETARTAHIALNCVNILLFAWQVGASCHWRLGASGRSAAVVLYSVAAVRTSQAA